MYKAYFDESGTHSESKTLVVSGWVSSDEQWLTFETQWRDLLSDFGITTFHMRDFNHGLREFKSWKGDQSRRDTFTMRAVEIIRKNVRRGFASAVITDAYQKVNMKYFLREYLGSPYALAALTCVNKGRQWLSRLKYESPIIYIFEDGAEGRGEVIDKMREAKWPTPEFRKKHECIQLQISDFAAYELFKRCTDLQARILRTRRSWDGLYSIPNDWEIWEETALENFCQINNLPLRVA
jgi:hypothetical protein